MDTRRRLGESSMREGLGMREKRGIVERRAALVALRASLLGWMALLLERSIMRSEEDCKEEMVRL